MRCRILPRWVSALCLSLSLTSVLAQKDIDPGWRLTRAAYHDPYSYGGSMLVAVPDTVPLGLGEPINVIISGRSDPRVLAPTMSNGGIYNFFEAIAYGGECMGLGIGGPQHADLGDGQGWQPQWGVLRYQYFHDSWLGTCLESIYGGSHFRLFRQKTTGAYFLSASVERKAKYHHELTEDAYDLNRDYIVGNATGYRIDRKSIGLDYVRSGMTVKRGWQYNTTVEWVHDLFEKSRLDVNHYNKVQAIGANVTDGWTAILTVQVGRKVDQQY